MKKKRGTVTGFKLATSMNVYKRFIHYATRISSCDWYVYIPFKYDKIYDMYCSRNSELKITLLLVNSIVITECRCPQAANHCALFGV